MSGDVEVEDWINEYLIFKTLKHLTHGDFDLLHQESPTSGLLMQLADSGEVMDARCRLALDITNTLLDIVHRVQSKHNRPDDYTKILVEKLHIWTAEYQSTNKEFEDLNRQLNTQTVADKREATLEAVSKISKALLEDLHKPRLLQVAQLKVDLLERAKTLRSLNALEMETLRDLITAVPDEPTQSEETMSTVEEVTPPTSPSRSLRAHETHAAIRFRDTVSHGLRKKWSDSEEEALYKGVHHFGVGNWVKIQRHFRLNRSTVQLKDKWRNLQKHQRRLRQLSRKLKENLS